MQEPKKRTRFDVDSPGASELRDRIVHGAFKTEGQMVAFPLCFPAVSVPIVADESRITALDVTGDGVVYGGTSGHAAHLFVAMFHGVTGMAFDMGVVDQSDRTVGVCCGTDSFVAATNGPAGGRLVARELQATPFSLIQEWSIHRSPYRYIDVPLHGERILHIVGTADRRYAVGLSESAVFRYEFATGRVEVLGSVTGRGRLAALSDGTVVGRAGGNSLWRCRPDQGSVEPGAIAMPEGDWDVDPIWARDPDTGRLYTADADARIYGYDPGTGWTGPLTQVPYAPVTSMAVTFDGRLFGSSGTDMQRLFCYDPDGGSLADIGVAASTLQQRRYCYEYGDAVTGRDGEIVFGEDDDFGHLWLYFPRIKHSRGSTG